jgi:yecA family protein
MNALRLFLEHPDRPPGTLRYHELQGFLFAIASAPELVPPSEWMPMVFGGHEAGYESLTEAKAVSQRRGRCRSGDAAGRLHVSQKGPGKS